MKRPAFQFYPGDWLRATELRACSVGARGLWIDMICLMHEGSPYGHLKVGGKVILPPNLARMVGATLLETEGWLQELEDAEVFSRDESGCIFSRRMIRDEEVRNARASGGKLGGNPALKKDDEKVGGKVNLQPNLQPTPASASASASAIQIPPIPPKGGKTSSAVGLKAYSESLKANGQTFCSDYAALWAYTDKVGLSREYVELAWLVFLDRHYETEKRYTDWRVVFLKTIKGNWLKLWFIPPEGGYALTTTGKQAHLQFKAAAKRAA